MHDVGRSQFAQGGQIEPLVGHSPDVSQALEPSRSPWKRRIDRHKLHFVPLNPEVIGKHLGLHGLAPKMPRLGATMAILGRGESMTGHRRILRTLTHHDDHDASERP